MKRLLVLFEGRVLGEFTTSPDGRISFAYSEAWRNDDRTIPVSLSLPKTARRYGGGKVSNWLWNLLPDNERVIQRIADDTSNGQSRVSARNPLALLSKVGEECAGALQLIRPERLEAIESGAVEWLDSSAIALRLADLREHRGSTGRLASDRGQFSLAGAQAKTALHREGDAWGIPTGRIPTTHILKPPIPGLDGQVENEHFCLSLATANGLRTAFSQVMDFEGERAIVAARYDRTRRSDGTVIRIHQEDMCQALARHPEEKYQEKGGPGIHDIVTQVLAASSNATDDRREFLRAVAFNFVVGATDAHAKNYSILFGRASQLRLAPLYDINSLLPYTDDIRSNSMSMTVGKHAEFGRILPRHWVAQAKVCMMDADRTVADVRDLIARCPDLAQDVLRNCRESGLSHPVLDRLADQIAMRCTELAAVYGREMRTLQIPSKPLPEASVEAEVNPGPRHS